VQQHQEGGALAPAELRQLEAAAAAPHRQLALRLRLELHLGPAAELLPGVAHGLIGLRQRAGAELRQGLGGGRGE